MSTTETDLAMVDTVQAQLVDCAPPPEPAIDTVPLPATPDASPIQQASDATIEQTGAGPPPRVP